MSRPRIRRLITHAEFDECVVVQKKVWRHDDINLTPGHQFCIAVETGSILLGAFERDRLVGFVYSFPAVLRGRLCQHSHLLAVLPEHQGRGLGKSLKWAQREEALRGGYSLITWTFDPLQVRNATLNLHALGAVVRTYLPDFYGPMPSLVFAPGVPTDRLKAEWHIRTRRVAERRRRQPPFPDTSAFPLALEGRPRRGLALPGPARTGLRAKRLLVETPRNIRDYRERPGDVRLWQRALRRTMEHYFSRGYVLADFVPDDRCFYVLER